MAIKEMCDKLISNLSQQTGKLEHFVLIMNQPTIEKFLSELKGGIRYKGFRLVSDISMRDGEVCMMNWDDYAREKDKFNQRMGLHL
ncbi:hypothetical protein LCGC14_1747040 [marine sediment metagenome]|uniref:Uncharacterized protein n=1 Tax=marine sediment metagenome TaxID=412755 RepID=A0A0F9HSC2_9ZZZZ